MTEFNNAPGNKRTTVVALLLLSVILLSDHFSTAVSYCGVYSVDVYVLFPDLALSLFVPPPHERLPETSAKYSTK